MKANDVTTLPKTPAPERIELPGGYTLTAKLNAVGGAYDVTLEDANGGVFMDGEMQDPHAFAAAMNRPTDGLREALGAHIQADAYRETFPDNDEDAAQLRKGETWWRLTARSWMSESQREVCAEMAKQRAAQSPEVKAALDKVAKRLAAQPTDTGEPENNLAAS